EQPLKVGGRAGSGIKKHFLQVRDEHAVETLHAPEVHQPDRAVLAEQIVAPMWIRMKRVQTQQLKVEQIYEALADHIAKRRRRPLGEKRVEVIAGEERHREHSGR